MSYFNSQGKLRSIQSQPRNLHDNWNHLLFTSTSQAQVVLAVELNGATILSSIVSRSAFVCLSRAVDRRVKPSFALEAQSTIKIASTESFLPFSFFSVTVMMVSFIPRRSR